MKSEINLDQTTPKNKTQSTELENLNRKRKEFDYQNLPAFTSWLNHYLSFPEKEVQSLDKKETETNLFKVQEKKKTLYPLMTKGNLKRETQKIFSRAPFQFKLAGLTLNTTPPQNTPLKIDINFLAQTIVKEARLISQKGLTQLDLNLKPEGIGTVKLKISLQKGELFLKIEANPEIKAELDEHLSELTNLLKAENLNLAGLDLSSNDNHKRDADDFGEYNFPQQNKEDEEDFFSPFTEGPVWDILRESKDHLFLWEA